MALTVGNICLAGFRIGQRDVGLSRPCLIVGEVAQAHDGKLDSAHAYIDAVADAGVDAVKFQTHIASAESTKNEPWRVNFSARDVSRYDYWKRMEFSEAQWLALKQHAEDRKLIFLSSPFSVEAVDLLFKLNIQAWKIPSGEINNTVLFERIASTGLPVLLSTGMSPLSEIDAAVAMIRKAGQPLVVMQCASRYPSMPESVGMNLVSDFRHRYNSLVGLSDHSGTIYPGLAAVTLGIEVLEVHVTLNREGSGPDVPSSVTVSELSGLVNGIRFIEKMKANPLDKDREAVELMPLRQIFNKSIVADEDLSAGVILSKKHLAFKKPGTGLPVNMLGNVLGRRLLRPLMRDEMVKEEDLEDVK